MLGKIIRYKSVLKKEKVDLIWRCFESIGRVETNSRKLLKLVMAVAYWMTSVMLDWSLHQIKEMTIKRTNLVVQKGVLKDFQKPPKNWGKLCFFRKTLEGSLRRWIAPPPPLSTPITSRERERGTNRKIREDGIRCHPWVLFSILLHLIWGKPLDLQSSIRNLAQQKNSVCWNINLRFKINVEIC